MLEQVTALTREHALDARKTWPGAHACSCGWLGMPDRPNGWGKPHYVHLAEVLTEWFEQYEQ